ncbi:NAD-dependent epimerase/dehydratase family protein [Micromonospora sp. DT43]|uniref:NAD-dependent epimerase/dehydratase family protein n=1 Tax=Micromonospora sp. DT43 TaxID=3393440 RepID=UPI003CF704AF
MAVVVTGAAGFIAGHLVAQLRGAGETVIGIDRRDMSQAPGLQPLIADLSDPCDEAVEALRTADAVFHLAGCPGVRDRSPDVQWRRRRDNVLSTEQVLRHVPRGTPLVVASSSSVYGGSDGRPCREDFPLRPRGGYAQSKLEMEHHCAAQRERGALVVTARFFTVAGERQRPDMGLAGWIRAGLEGRAVPVFGDLSRSRDLVDVLDLVAAVRALADRGVPGTVNIGTGQAHSLGQMLDALRDALDRPITVTRHPVDADDPNATLADPTHLHSLTGLRPRTDIRALIRRQVVAALRDADAQPAATVTGR